MKSKKFLKKVKKAQKKHLNKMFKTGLLICASSFVLMIIGVFIPKLWQIWGFGIWLFVFAFGLGVMSSFLRVNKNSIAKHKKLILTKDGSLQDKRRN